MVIIMSKKFIIEVVVPEGLNAGDTFTVEVEAPVAERKQRGVLAGIALEDMSDDQLKREIINANSVLYKAKQRGAAEETIAHNQARVEAAKAEKAKRDQSKVVVNACAEVAPSMEETTEETGVYNAEVDAETAAEM